MRTVLLTGLPRSGTTLACALLNQIPDVLALAEPIPLAGVVDRAAALKTVADFVRTTRRQALSEGLAPTRSRAWRGDNLAEAPRPDGGLRAGIGDVQPLTIDRPLSSDFLLCIKHPALFTALAEDLSRDFPVFAVVRSPLAALASWQTLDFLPHHGRSVVAERMDPGLAARLGQIEDRLDRQVELIGWYLAAFAKLPARHVIRYEDLVADPASQLSLFRPAESQQFAGISHAFQEQAPEDRYPSVDFAELARRLSRILALIERFYPDYGETLAHASAGKRAAWRGKGVDGHGKARIDFLVAGVQKCGTTALADHLGRHPAVRMSNRKEVHFFDQDDRNWVSPDYERYHRWFQPPAPGAEVIGEATPIYLYWPKALERLKAYNPDAKLVVVLRHPTFRAYSHWRMEMARGQEVLDFSQAVRGEGRRRLGWGGNGAHRVHSYVERGLYAPQIKRLLGLFPKAQCCFVRTDRLWLNADRELRTVQRFIGVDPIGVYGAPGHASFRTEAAPVLASDRRYLDEVFAADIRETQALVDLDISDWLRSDYQEPMGQSAGAMMAAQ